MPATQGTMYDRWVAQQQADNPLWPWVAEDNRPGPTWPRPEESERFDRYVTAKWLVDGTGHFDTFEAQRFASESHTETARVAYVVVNMIDRAVDAVHRILADGKPEIEAGDSALAMEMVGGEDGLADLANRLLRSRLVYGDAALLIRTTPDQTWLESQDVTDCTPLPFADRRYDAREVRVCREFVIKEGSQEQRYVYIIAFRPGSIWQSLWRVNEGCLAEQVPLGTVPEVGALAGITSEAQTELVIPQPRVPDAPLMLWSARSNLDGLEGRSLFNQALPAQAQIGRRLTQRENKLSAMDNPRLVIHSDDIAWDPLAIGGIGGYVASLSATRVMVRQGDENTPDPRWLVQDPMIEANKLAADDALRHFATLCGISVASITQDIEGQVPESGTALRMRHRETVQTAQLEAAAVARLIGRGLRLAMQLKTGQVLSEDAVRISWKPSGMWAEEEQPDLGKLLATPRQSALQPAADTSPEADQNDLGSPFAEP